MSLVSVTDVKTHLNLSGTSYDTELQVFTDAAEQIVESHLGRPLSSRTVTSEQHRVYGGYEVALRHVPCPCQSCLATRVLTITSVTLNGATLGVGDYTLVTEKGILYRNRGITPWYTIYPDGIQVTYTAGYSAAPAWLNMAILRTVEGLWQKSQLAPHPALGQSGGGFDEFAPSTQHVLTYATQALIDPHRAPGF